MRRQTIAAAMALTGLLSLTAPAIAEVVEPPLVAIPQDECGPGSRPETGLQGQVSIDDHASGRAAEGFTCNTEQIGTFISKDTPDPVFGSVGGFKVLRYVDAAGHECAYYDSTLLFPTNVGDQEAGVVVLDMTDPSAPVQTTKLVAPAMLQPHESLVLSEERGIIAAITGTLATNPGILNVYDIKDDCRNPQLTTAFTTVTDQGVPLLGHESGLSPDGMTFWAASTATDYVFAIDITDLTLPSILYVSESGSHGVTVGNDGTRTYFANSGEGLIIVDTTDIANRVEDPQVTEISRLDWTSRSIPQNAIPFTNNGKQYVFEIDEFGSCAEVGAARIIDVNDETAPFVLSNLRLEVHDPENFDAICDDPGTQTPAIQGYAGHYCHIPTRVDPTIAACSMIVSGLRIFDITDPALPVEIAYFNAPVADRPAFDTPLSGGSFQASNYAMSAPAFVPERKEIWYTDGFQGFYAVRVTNDVWPDTLADGIHTRPDGAIDPAGENPSDGVPGTDPVLAVTGAAGWLQALGALLLLGALGMRGPRRTQS